MGVYIQSMEMPRDCWSCVMSSFGTCNFMGRIWDPDPGQPLRPDWCPLRPLPEKHGRLIDADALEDIIGKFSTSWEYGQGVSDCWDALIDSPTIVEVEGE